VFSPSFLSFFGLFQTLQLKEIVQNLKNSRALKEMITMFQFLGGFLTSCLSIEFFVKWEEKQRKMASTSILEDVKLPVFL
jgi:hypothetical protein